MTGEPAFWQRLESGSRAIVPVLLTLILTLIAVLPTGIPYLGPVMPLLPLMSIYYWAIYRPDLMPMYATFGIGLLQDALSGTPFGLSAAVFVVVHAVVSSLRRFFDGKSHVILWLGFVILVAGALMLGWLIAAVYYFAVPAVVPVLFQLGLTVALFPCATLLFGLVLREVVRPI